MIKYKNFYSKTNIVVDVLSRRHVLISKLGAQILGFEHIHELNSQDFDFSFIFAMSKETSRRLLCESGVFV